MNVSVPVTLLHLYIALTDDNYMYLYYRTIRFYLLNL